MIGIGIRLPVTTTEDVRVVLKTDEQIKTQRGYWFMSNKHSAEIKWYRVIHNAELKQWIYNRAIHSWNF